MQARDRPTMEPEDYVTANRNAWDDSAPHHRANATWQRLSEAFAAGGYSCLDVFDQATLGKIGLVGKDVAQICCNNGRELLSIRNLGARRCVGFDQSAAFLSRARELNALAELTASSSRQAFTPSTRPTMRGSIWPSS